MLGSREPATRRSLRLHVYITQCVCVCVCLSLFLVLLLCLLYFVHISFYLYNIRSIIAASNHASDSSRFLKRWTIRWDVPLGEKYIILQNSLPEFLLSFKISRPERCVSPETRVGENVWIESTDRCRFSSTPRIDDLSWFKVVFRKFWRKREATRVFSHM